MRRRHCALRFLTNPHPRRPENRRFVGAAYPSRAAAHNAEGAPVRLPHTSRTPPPPTATRPKPGGGGGERVTTMKLDMIAFEAEMERLRSAYIFDIAPAIEMYRAALARVAELEAEVARLRQVAAAGRIKSDDVQ
jgi:hypothetical protein